MFDASFLKVYFIAGTQDCIGQPETTPQRRLLATLETALRAGITCFQFREKGALALKDKQQIKQLAQECRDLCREFKVPFVLNNDVLLALELGADGVHIGQNDMPFEQAIAHCGERLFLGVSNSSIADLQRSLAHRDIDYLAVGPVFETPSKPDAAAVVGLDFVRLARETVGDKPLVAIGGITADTASQVRAAGADGVAVISAIARAENAVQTVAKLRG